MIASALVDWSRAQFALTAGYHWIFVPLTLGLAVIMASMETLYVIKKDEFWKRTAKFWMKLFAINFAVGIATGIILEFEFGTNWSNYSWFVGLTNVQNGQTMFVNWHPGLYEDDVLCYNMQQLVFAADVVAVRQFLFAHQADLSAADCTVVFCHVTIPPCIVVFLSHKESRVHRDQNSLRYSEPSSPLISIKAKWYMPFGSS